MDFMNTNAFKTNAKKISKLMKFGEIFCCFFLFFTKISQMDSTVEWLVCMLFVKFEFLNEIGISSLVE